MNKQGKNYLVAGIVMFLLVGAFTFYFVNANGETCIQHSTYKECELNGEKSLEVYEYKYKDKNNDWKNYKENIKLNIQDKKIKVELTNKFKFTLDVIPTLNGIETTWKEINLIYPNITFNIPKKNYKAGIIKFDLNLSNGGLMGENIPNDVGLKLKLIDKFDLENSDIEILNDGLMLFGEFKLWIPEGCADITKNEITYTTLNYYCLDPSLEVGEDTIMGGSYEYTTIIIHSNSTVSINNSIGWLELNATTSISIYGEINGNLKSNNTGGGGGGGGSSCASGSSGGTGLYSGGNGGGGGGAAGYQTKGSAGSSGGGSSILGTEDGRYELIPGKGAGGGGGGGCGYSGGCGASGSNGGAGNRGGGTVNLESPIIFINGTISVNGGTGGTGGAGGNAGGQAQDAGGGGGGGGGGSSAGMIIIDGINVNISHSTLTLQGGGGGSGGNGGSHFGSYPGYDGSNGGAGSGGRCKIFYTSLDNTSTTITEGTGTIYYKLIDIATPNVTINSPTNTTYYTNTTNFSLSVVDDSIVDSCWFTLNSGVTNYTMTNVTASVFNYTNSSMTNMTHTVNFYCNDTSNNINNTESETFTIYPPTSIFVDLVSPTDGTVMISLNASFYANYTAINLNLTNVSYYMWYSNGSIFNQTNFTITGLTNSTNLSLTNMSLGDFEWNAYACSGIGSHSLCDWATSNYTFTVGDFLSDEVWNNYTFETASEDFQLNLTLFSGSSLISANLTYNGTHYPVSDITIENAHYVLKKTIDIPLTPNYFEDVLYEFNWSFIYVNAFDVQTHQTTTTRNQNVTYLVINICNATYSSDNSSALNFTIYNEITGNQINATTNNTDLEVTFEYWVGSGSVVKNYSYQNLTNNKTSNYEFCIFPLNETLQVNMDMQYGAADYSPRTYYLRNASLDNETNDIRLELLEDSEAVKFFVEVRQGVAEFPGATVTISKYFTGEGGYRAISIRETDVDGKFIEYLELDQTYQFSIVKNGISYGTLTKQSFCTVAPCEITLQIEEAETDMWQGYYAEFATNVAYTLDYNDTTKIVTYTFNDLTGLAQSFALDVIDTKYNESSAIVFEPDGTYCNKTLAAVAGTLSCNMTNYTKGDFKAIGYISRSPAKIVDTINFVISSIKDVLGQLGIFASFLIIVVIGLVGVWNPAVGVILTAFAVLMMKLLGFVAFSYTTVILIIIMAIILAFKMKS